MSTATEQPPAKPQPKPLCTVPDLGEYDCPAVVDIFDRRAPFRSILEGYGLTTETRDTFNPASPGKPLEGWGWYRVNTDPSASGIGIRRNLPPCGHSHDCCGCTFAISYHITRTLAHWIVTRTAFRNY